jgi:hypothetical protein
MFIIDNKNKRIEVTDLEASLRQVEIFVNLTHQDPSFVTLDTALKAYWQDVQQKLLALKEEQK